MPSEQLNLGQNFLTAEEGNLNKLKVGIKAVSSI